MSAISDFYNVKLSRIQTFPLEPFLTYGPEETVKQVVERIKFAPLTKVINGQEVTIEFEATIGGIYVSSYSYDSGKILGFVPADLKAKMCEFFPRKMATLRVST